VSSEPATPSQLWFRKAEPEFLDKLEDREMKTLEGGHKNEERGTGRASGAFAIRV